MKHNVFTEDVNEIALSANDNKRMHSIDSIETNAYGTNKHLVSNTEKMKCNNMIKQYKND